MDPVTYSIVIPVYKNEESIGRLIKELKKLNLHFNHDIEFVFVIDGSPDRSFEFLEQGLSDNQLQSQLICHARNFGSFSAIRTGLAQSNGTYSCVMAADLQEPISLAQEMLECLSAEQVDVVMGQRRSRQDPFLSRVSSETFWWMYRRLVVPEMPKGGVDVFGCNDRFKQELLLLNESRTSLVALLFWLGFRRKFVLYERLSRLEGKSAWTFRKKLSYLSDSIFAFTNLPIKAITGIGAVGVVISTFISIVVAISKIMGLITVSGYTAIILAICFFGALNLFSIGVLGSYAWRAYENTKHRPSGIVIFKRRYGHGNF